MKPPKQSGFTLVELLVVIAIIGMMVSMLMPAVSATRETARRTQCMSQLTQIAMAAADYESTYGCLPAGVTNDTGPIQNQASGNHHSWTIALLPFLDLNSMAQHIDRGESVYDPIHDEIRRIVPAVFVCPSAGNYMETSAYAGVHHDVEAPIDVDNHGLLFLNSRIRSMEIVDGRAFTLLVGEKQIFAGDLDLGWMSGTRATLRNTGTPLNATPRCSLSASLPSSQPEGATPVADDPLVAAAGDAAQMLFVGGLGSAHPGITGVSFADGHIRYLGNSIDQNVLQHLGHRADGALVDLAEVE